MSLTGKTIGQLTYLSGLTPNTLFPVELSGDTYHAAYSAFTNANYNSVTYDELYGNYTGSTLTPGNFYLITDFQTCYDQPNFDPNGNTITTGNYKTGATESLVVFASSNNTLSPFAFSLDYPKDKITYDISWNTTEVTNSPAKGRITERIDNNNNRADYDFRAVQFIRYEALYSEEYYNGTISLDGSGNVTGIGTNFSSDFSTGQYLGVFEPFNNIGSFTYYEILTISDDTNMTVTGFSINTVFNMVYSKGITEGTVSPFQCNVLSLNSSSEYYTFELGGSDVFSNYLGNNTNYNTFILSNNVFLGNQFNNYFGPNVTNNTFDDDMNNNVCGAFFRNNILTNDFDNNIIGTFFEYNVIIDDFNDNTIGSDFRYNMIGNLVGGNFDSNIIQNNFGGNFITQNGEFKDNIIGEFFQENVIHALFEGNNIKESFQNNKILESFRNNNISGIFNGVTIQDLDSSNIFQNNNFTYRDFNTSLLLNGGLGGNPIFYTSISTNVVRDASDNTGYVTFLSGGTFVARDIIIVPVSPTPTPTVTPTPSVTPTITPTPTSSEVPVTPTPSITPSVTPTITQTPTVTPTESAVAASPTPTPTLTPTPSPVPTFTIINNSTGDRTVTNITGGVGSWTLDNGSYPVSAGQSANGFSHPALTTLGLDQLAVLFGGTNAIDISITKNGLPYAPSSSPSPTNVTASQINYFINNPADVIQVNDIIVFTISDTV